MKKKQGKQHFLHKRKVQHSFDKQNFCIFPFLNIIMKNYEGVIEHTNSNY